MANLKVKDTAQYHSNREKRSLLTSAKQTKFIACAYKQICGCKWEES